MALTLHRYATVRAQRGDYGTVARILGAVHMTSAPAWNNAFRTVDADAELASMVRTGLGDAAFNSAWQTGMEMSLQQAVATILNDNT